MSKRRKRFGVFDASLNKTMRRARNAVRLMSGARFTPPYERPYDIAMREGFMRLRHYDSVAPKDTIESVLLVPPLMVTAQVYDISPPLSSVALLANQGMDVWLCDFGSPETEEDGLKRTLDEHLLAIDAAIEQLTEMNVRDITVLPLYPQYSGATPGSI